MTTEVQKVKTVKSRIKNIGPAAIVTSAFVGPGTITTTTVAGNNFQYSLLWPVLFSGISLIILMGMAGRIGIISNHDISEASISTFGNSKVASIVIKGLIIITMFTTIFGFEAGNLIGGSLGLADVINIPQWTAAILLGVAALYAVVVGTAKSLEKLMSLFVGIMGLTFILAMLLANPNYGDVARGLIPTSLPSESGVAIIALVGTTLSGYAILMHSVNTAEKWSGPEYLKVSRFDTNLNIGIGTLITMAIIITSGAVLFGTGTTVDTPIVFSQMLEPVLGSYARTIGNIGITAAGLSSAIAAPLALKIVITRLFKWDINGKKAKIVGGSAVVFGTIFAAFGTSPTQIIIFASASSGLFLPVVAILLMIAANNKKLLGEYRNNLSQNLLGGIATLITIMLGMNSLLNFFQNLTNL